MRPLSTVKTIGDLKRWLTTGISRLLTGGRLLRGLLTRRLLIGGLLVTMLWSLPSRAEALSTDSMNEPVGSPPLVTQTTSQSPPQTTDIPSEKISQFAQAYIQVVGLINERGRELQQAETEAESLQIEQSIQSEAFRLMREHDLQVAEYLQLLGLANQDDDFRDRILAEIEETQ
ncbi:MAG: DUF4168 domain-containing protein [Cyanobacteria bacterium P01_A01_bin.114]